MCGIAASFAYSPEAPSLNRMEPAACLSSMASRGPDGSGIWFSQDSRASLAHCRLSILDLSSNAAQPMANAQNDLLVAFNGEIYNFKALRTQLQEQGYSFRSDSDTEVLLHLYEEKGARMVEDLRGMYAFAIWDVRRKGLFLARDPYGIKPLYYADDGCTLRVASQVKALLSTGKIDTSPEPAGHVGFFLWGHVPDPFTLFKGIRALPAGHTFWVDTSGRKELKAFVSLRDILAEGQEARKPIKNQGDNIGACLRDSIRHHLVSDVPVGLFLSSGLDSISLLGLVAEEVSQLRTVTLGFEEFRGQLQDETVLAALAARQFGARHQTVWVGKSDFENHFDKMLDSMDQPSIDGVNTFFVSYAAAQSSLKVAISGLGGDELFGGYPSFAGIPRLVRSLQAFGSFKGFGKTFRHLSAPVFKCLTSPKYAGLLEYGTAWEGAYLLRRGLFMPWELVEIFDPEFASQGWEQLCALQTLHHCVQGLQSDHARVCALESSWYMRNQLLRDSDWASMAHSIELRVPLADLELLRQVAPLMSDGSGLSKQAMVNSVKLPLPDSIRNRPKTGFAVPVRDWIMEKRSSHHSERGLRGWAHLVYQHFCESSRRNLSGPLRDLRPIRQTLPVAA